MLVTFHTDAYPDITMFGEVATRLLKLMGHSGTVPSAIRAADVPAALASLEAAVTEMGTEPLGQANPPREDEDRAQPVISLAQRAFPLIELLKAAAANDDDVMWRK